MTYIPPTDEQTLQRRINTAMHILHHYALEPGDVYSRAEFCARELRGVARLLDSIERQGPGRDGARSHIHHHGLPEPDEHDKRAGRDGPRQKRE